MYIWIEVSLDIQANTLLRYRGRSISRGNSIVEVPQQCPMVATPIGTTPRTWRLRSDEAKEGNTEG